MKYTFLLGLLINCFIVSAQGKYGGGDGSAKNPYQIQSVDDLSMLFYNPGDWHAHFIQTADIIFPDEEKQKKKKNYKPIGTDEKHYFSGSYDGKGYSIDGLYLIDSENEFVGLFGYSYNAVFKNIHIKNCRVKGDKYIGALSGYCFNVSIENCSVEGKCKGSKFTGMLVGSIEKSVVKECVAVGAISDEGLYNGGLIGQCQSTTVSKSSARVNVTGKLEDKGSTVYGGLIGRNIASQITDCFAATSVNANIRIGGLIGVNEENSAITNCYTTGEVYSSTSAGGLIGKNIDSPIANCFSHISVTGKNDCGGFIGINEGASNITKCFADGNVEGNDNIGGLIGNNSGIITDCYSLGDVIANHNGGGLIGQNKGLITNCYASGAIVGIENPNRTAFPKSNNLGGLAGENEGGTITNCFANGAVTGHQNIGGLIGHTNKGSIKNTFASGYVFGEDAVGGLIGLLRFGNTLELSTAKGKVVGLSRAGGLIGSSMYKSDIKNCYAPSKVVGYNTLGGFIGEMDALNITECYSTGKIMVVQGDQLSNRAPSKSSFAGGFAGVSNQAEVSNCYTTAYIEGKDDIGGFIGKQYRTNISNSYAKGYVKGENNVGGFVGSTTYYKSDITACFSGVVVSAKELAGSFIGSCYDTDISRCYLDLKTDTKLKKITNTHKFDDKILPVPFEKFVSNVGFVQFDFHKNSSTPWVIKPNKDVYLNWQKVSVSNGELFDNFAVTGNVYVQGSQKITETGIRFRVIADEKWQYRKFSGTNLTFNEKVSLPDISKGYFIQPYAKDSDGMIYYGDMITTVHRKF